MQSLLIIAELGICIALIIVILLQRSEGGALGMGGGGSGLGGLFSPRGAADTLTQTTSILALLFFLVCLALNLTALRGRNEKSILDTAPGQATSSSQKPVSPGPQRPAVPGPH